MKSISVPLALFALLAACSPIERSRELGNGAVPATALAQQVCSACHGVTGVSTSPAFPHLAGQPASYLENQLLAFRSRQRADPAAISYMWGMARHLTDTQIHDLAAYYARQQPAPPEKPKPGLEANGRMIVEGGIPKRNVAACAACHGANGLGSAAAPRLAGQHADYLLKQLNIFRNAGGRPGSPEMRAVAQGLDDDDVRAVAAYLASISGPSALPALSASR